MTYHFDGRIAAMYGVDEAVFIAMLQFWIAKNEANDRHFHDGRYWTYNSIRAMERLFPWWSKRQIERIVKKLKDAGVVLTANYNRDSHDRTLFYSLDESKLPISPFCRELSPNCDSTPSPNGDDLAPNGEMYKEQLNTQLKEEEEKPDGNIKPLELMERYNTICTGMPQAVKLTEKRAKAVRRLYATGYTSEQLIDVFYRAQASSFCTGSNDRGWRADFDWLMSENNLVKVLEGKYGGSAAPAPHRQNGGYEQW